MDWEIIPITWSNRSMRHIEISSMMITFVASSTLRDPLGPSGAQTPGAIFSVRWIVEPSVRFSAAMPVGARARKSTLRAFRSDMKALST